MSSESLDRRRFHALSAAALSGLVAGTLAGCGPKNVGVGQTDENSAGEVALGEKHLCRGLNDCKGQGVAGKNDCRGQGECATFEKHTCAHENACKGQGGCGENPGLNDCKGQGGCSVPLMDSAWDIVRKRKEAEWTKAEQEFGQAPAKAESAS
jgi:hypothetical protein